MESLRKEETRMARCRDSDLQSYIDWILHQTGGMREHVLGVKLYDQLPETFIPDIYDGYLIYIPFLQLPPPGRPGLDIKAILSGTAALEGIGGARVQVIIGIGHEALAIRATLQFLDRRVDLEELECEGGGQGALLMSGDVNGEFFRIELERLTTFRNPSARPGGR
jgi:hypothetical protein